MDKFNKILYYEPNADGNEIPSTEDLNIYVSLESTTRSRNIIRIGDTMGESNITGGGKSRPIKFIDGTDGSLTTSYTESSNKFKNNLDAETLGIDSINIDFDTAYTPLVKIKFIDVRGMSVIEKGDKSKYKMFFELPYPIFSLTVKGYYGKPVKYCLHLLKWNAKFNSNTGYFEIDAEFIGYTYAILTDLLLGYLRVVVKTSIGSTIFNKYKDKYAAQDIELKTIDEFIDDVKKLDEVYNKIRNKDEGVSSLNSIKFINLELEKIKTILIKLYSNITNSESTKKYYNENDVVVINRINRADYFLTTYKTDIKKLIDQDNNGLNSLIESDELKLVYEKLINYNVISNINIQDISNEDDINKITELIYKYSKPSYDRTTDKAKVTNIANIIKESIPVDAKSGGIVIYDFSNIVDEIDRVKESLKSVSIDVKKMIGEKVKEISKDELGFDPTIRNIFRILTTHCEIFLETLSEVSRQAEASNERGRILKSLIEDGNTNIPKESDTVYAWPEIRRKNTQGAYEESWIGKGFSQSEKNKIDELLFVEEVLKELIILGKRDNERIEEENSGFANTDQFYPITPIDSMMLNKDNVNPYKEALFNDKSRRVNHEATRCLLMRGFLALGVSNVKYDSKYIKAIGSIEAYNLFNSILNNTNKDNILDLLNSINSNGSIASKRNSVLNLWKSGVNDIENPFGIKTPLLIEGGDEYKYVYIRRPESDINSFTNEKVYLPVNRGFDGQDFYINDKTDFKNNNDLKDLSETLLFTNNNFGTNRNIQATTSNDDGTKTFKIISRSEYERSVNTVNFGDKYINEIYKKNIDENSILQQNTFNKSLYSNNPMGNLNPYTSQLKAQEFFNINYNGGELEGSNNTYFGKNKEASVLCSFWSERVNIRYPRIYGPIVGTYLSSIDPVSANQIYYVVNPGDNIVSTTRLVINDNGEDMNINLRKFGNQRQLLGDLLGLSNNSNDDDGNTTIHVPFIEFGITKDLKEYYFSLFGSKFYYGQDNDYAKSFLFLHSFGWHGVIGDKTTHLDLTTSSDPTTTIKALFKNNAGFIKAPKLWCAFIGGILYRLRESSDIIKYYDIENDEFLLPWMDFDSTKPNKDEYLYNTHFNTSYGIHFNFNEGSYKLIDETLINLPIQIKNEFIDYFTSFTENEFITIKSELELFKDNKTFNVNYNKLVQNIKQGVGGKNIIEVDLYPNIFNDTPDNVIKNYNIITPGVASGWDPYMCQFSLTIKYNSNVTSILTNLISDSVILLNGSPKSFRNTPNTPLINDNIYHDISVNKKDMDVYLDSFYTTFDTLVSNFQPSDVTIEDDVQQQIFNSIDDNLIKLTIYRTLGSIYTKWLGGTNGLFNLCGTMNDSDNSLINSFKFLDRSFSDIGDEFYIDPSKLTKLMVGNYNQSFFDLINRVLSDNYFNFIALPTFLNFTDVNQVKDMFKPYSYNDLTSKDFNAGPSFICTYVGQVSTNLDIGSVNYEDDGVLLKINSKGEILDAPIDFIKDDRSGSINVPMIGVSYGKGNQSVFKDIALDQKEFSETSESLQIIEDITVGGDKSKSTYVGQNLFNVYQTRSYSAEIEMMGNAMMQPMMYFHLNNIPMFRGAYMIIKVSHNITANSMTTKFKGVRIKNTKTPLVDASTLFMNLLNVLDSDDDTPYNKTKIRTGVSIQNKEKLRLGRLIDSSVVGELNFTNPVTNGTINSVFGPRDINVSYASKFHLGVDIGVPNGTNVYCVGDGVIELIRLRNGYGLHIVTTHTTNDGEVFRVLYGHLSDINKNILNLDTLTQEQRNALTNGGIKLDKNVKINTLIASSGGDKNETSSINGINFKGTSGGPHLHFEIREEKTPKIVSSPSGIYFDNSTPKDPLILIPMGYNNPKYAISDIEHGDLESDVIV